ncbi:MAG: hypothetical protein ACOYYS_28465 [Chloroflexota bacterium]
MDWKILLAGLLLAAAFLYGFGALFNRQRSQAVLRWLAAGAKHAGKPSAVHWRGRMHAAGRLDVTDLRPPYRTMVLIFVLERRDNLPVWLFKHFKGQRDELFIHADLRSLPDPEIEAGPQGSRSVQSRLFQRDAGYRKKNDSGIFDIAWRGKESHSTLTRVQRFLHKYPKANLRFSLGQESPHLALRVNLGPLLRQSPEQFFDDLREAVR